jgi:hypothetical protein
MLNTDPTLDGHAYVFARCTTGEAPDTPTKTFAKSNVKLNRVFELEYEFTTDDSDDYMIVLGVYGRGIIIVDDISITKK